MSVLGSNRSLIRRILLKRHHRHRASFTSSATPPVPVEEVSVEMPMGRLRGKIWGSASSSNCSGTILAIHGWLDNCGSFAPLAPRLLPLLREDTRLIALDMPGHGLSERLPPGMSYTITDSLIVIHKAQVRTYLPSIS